MSSHEPMPTGTVAPESGTTLRREAIGLREVLFQSITHMAPAAAVAFSIPAGAAFAGGALPLAVIFALIGCMFVAISIGQLAKHLPSAGAFYTYTAKGLHPAIGFLVAWGYAIVEPLVAPLLYIILGITVAGTFNAEFGWSADLWWVWALAGAVIVFILGYLGIRVSARTNTILGIFEIGVFLALGIWLIFEAGDNNSLEVFGTEFANNPDFAGFTGVIAASIYSILAFIGFEAAAPLAEEAKDPRRTIKLAVVYSALAIGLYYVITTYGATVFIGPEEMTRFLEFGEGNPWDFMAREVWGVGWVLVFLAIINSAIANSNAGANAATRTWYAMGRIRILPALLARVHPRYRSPHVAVIIQFLVGIGIPLWIGFQYDPLTAFVFVATMITIVVLLIYMLVNLACLFYYLRYQRSEFNWLLHGVIPVLGILVFIPAFLTAAGITVFDFIGELEPPVSYAGLWAGGLMLIGLVYLVVLYSTNPQRVRDTDRVFLDEGAPATPPPAP
jgi:amino acid transporter